jgi:hypothetical protein
LQDDYDIEEELLQKGKEIDKINKFDTSIEFNTLTNH